jgi:hypothetical protein
MKHSICILLFIAINGFAIAQIDSSKYLKPVNNTAKQNQEHMMQLLGIKKISPTFPICTKLKDCKKKSDCKRLVGKTPS